MNSRLKCHRLAWVVASGFTLREPEHKDVSTGGCVPTLVAADWSPYFRGATQQGPRREFLYWTDDGISPDYDTTNGRSYSSSNATMVSMCGRSLHSAPGRFAC
jgi:hypothetical protein